MKTKTLNHIYHLCIFLMQIIALVSMGAKLAYHEWIWAIQHLGNFFLWTLVFVLSLQRDKYYELLKEAFNFLEELKEEKKIEKEEDMSNDIY